MVSGFRMFAEQLCLDPSPSNPTLLGGSWAVISRVTSMVTLRVLQGSGFQV